MPLWPRPRISCFYCGSSSQHRKGDGTRSFQCTICEGTNYLDLHGNITDVPAQVAERHEDAGLRLAQSKNLQPDLGFSDPVFCSQCINNQRILNDCIANYFPPESDPRFDEFAAGFDQYKADLEKRYPQVCPKCEPRVRKRLKRNTYLAQSDSLSKRLADSRASLLATQTASTRFYAVAGAAWNVAIVIQAAWHLSTALGATDILAETPQILRIAGSDLAEYLNLVTALSLLLSTALIWWNPTFSHPGTFTCAPVFFYVFQTAMLLFRWSFWIITEGPALSTQGTTKKALHYVAFILTTFTLLATSRLVVRKIPYKVPHRDLNAPLVDKENVQQLEQDLQKSALEKPVFRISNLKASEKPPQYAPDPANMATSRENGIENQSGADAMDWEPTPQTYKLRPRVSADKINPSKPFYPSTSAFSAFPPQPGMNPFHGSLPPAPKSMEARLRSAANRPPPQFVPTTDAKQADWFKRMGLAQSKTNWAGKDYVHRVRCEDEVPDLAPGKLDLPSLTRSADTGLETMFGSSFNLNDRGASPEKSEEPPAEPELSKVWIQPITLMVVMSIPATMVLLYASKLDLAVFWAQWMQKLHRLAYGQGLG